MHILVIGATGVLGRHVVPRLIERGHTVRAVARKPEQAAQLQRIGVEATLGDILDATSLNPAAVSCDVALHLATAIPKPGGPQHWDVNDRIRREGTQNLLNACRQAGVSRYVQQSTVFLYEDRYPALADETAPFLPHPMLQSTYDMEALVKESTLHWSILRGGFFYGPGTLENAWRDAARQGALQFPGDGSGRLSLIHVTDMARAVVLAAEQAPAQSVYNVVDDQPVTYAALFAHLAAITGSVQPTAGGPAFLPSFSCSNARLKTALGWSPTYPTYRSGLAQ
ncbi:MAG TPA: NAD(P)H-binding protein [Methylomirabilota bacterium]|nr:NAD(P)H-binding protein [Methylomirabilota bacterium]